MEHVCEAHALGHTRMPRDIEKQMPTLRGGQADPGGGRAGKLRRTQVGSFTHALLAPVVRPHSAGRSRRDNLLLHLLRKSVFILTALLLKDVVTRVLSDVVPSRTTSQYPSKHTSPWNERASFLECALAYRQFHYLPLSLPSLQTLNRWEQICSQPPPPLVLAYAGGWPWRLSVVGVGASIQPVPITGFYTKRCPSPRQCDVTLLPRT